MTEPLPSGATIGILGGGQLGRMLAVAASRLGMRCHIFEPDPSAPAAQVANLHTSAPYDDLSALRAFGESVDVVTYEFENIPTEALDALEAVAAIYPPRRALATSQDRLVEKSFLAELGLGTAPYADASSPELFTQALASIGTPSLLKTRRFGYDGKGQVKLSDAAGQGALSDIDNQPAILEGMVPFEREISVIAARGQDGAIVSFEPAENVHGDGILRTSTVPARVSDAQGTQAVHITGQILEALDYVGVIGVEMFVTQDGDLLVNEFAPRVHNSGHWTMDAAVPDQFELHIRAVAGWPLPEPKRTADVVMENLIGDDVGRVASEAARPGTAVHLYGKSEVRAGRKMGHINRVAPQ